MALSLTVGNGIELIAHFPSRAADLSSQVGRPQSGQAITKLHPKWSMLHLFQGQGLRPGNLFFDDGIDFLREELVMSLYVMLKIQPQGSSVPIARAE